MTDVQLEKSKFRETVRHNLAMEQGDFAKLNETMRHNLQDESIGRERNANERYRLETLDSREREKNAYDFFVSQLVEKNKDKELDEKIRHNKAQEAHEAKRLKVQAVNDYGTLVLGALAGMATPAVSGILLNKVKEGQ